MKELLLSVLTTSLTCSLLLAPLLLFAPKIHSRYTAKTLYFVWLALGLRLALPFSFSLPKAPVTVQVPRYTVYAPTAIAGTAIPPAQAAPATGGAMWASPPTVAQGMDVVSLLAILWAVGVAVFLLWNAGTYLLARRRLLKSAEYLGDNVYQSPLISTPMVIGLFRSVVLAPESGADNLALRHELCHIKRRDLWYKAFFLLVNAVHWFNPLAWLLAHEAGRNVELCCDDDVLRNADAAERRAYSQLLLSAAAGGNYPVLSTRFGSGKKQMKERLQNLFRKKKNSAALVALVLIAALLAGGLVACESSEGKKNQAGVLYDKPISAQASADTTEFTAEAGAGDVLSVCFENKASSPCKVILYRYGLLGAKDAVLSVEVAPGEKEEERYTGGSGSAIYYVNLSALGGGLVDGTVTVSQLTEDAAGASPRPTATADTEPVPDDVDRTDLDACVRDAILSHWTRGDEHDGDLQTESHVKLKVEEKEGRTTVYAMQLFLTFTGDSSGFYEQRGNSMPVAITFIKGEDGAYTPEEFWIPQDGSGYMESIQEKFPTDITMEQVDTQKYILGETQSCYAQAIAYWDVDTTPIIERLLDSVCAIPGATADNPDSYLNTDYRELTYYGKYTADYCVQALKTEGVSDLRAAVMTRLYGELK